jgi:hypothetical protein
VVTLLRQLGSHAIGGVVAVQGTGGWATNAELMVDGVRWRATRAGSELAIREILAAHEQAGAEDRVVILTPLDTTTVAMDVRARLARQRVFTVAGAELLLDLFRVRAVDPRVARQRWLADVLLEHAPPGGYPPAPSGVLDLDTAWAHVFSALLGMHWAAPDALGVLRWSTREGAVSRWAALPVLVQRELAGRLRDTMGRLGPTISDAMLAGHGHRLLAMGLVCDVLWPESTRWATVPEALREVVLAGRVRAESLFGGQLPAPELAREWAAIALRVLGEMPTMSALPQRRLAEQLLEELRAGSAVQLSAQLPSAVGWQAASLGAAITAALEGQEVMPQVVTAHEAFLRHVEVVADPSRSERATMAVRVLGALLTPGHEHDSGVGGMVRHYVVQGSWLDAARTSLLGGDPSAELSQAYAALQRAARSRREDETRRFADRLMAWNESPAAEPEVLPVERVLELIVAPIADVRRVLVILMDGMDLGVWRALHGDLATRHWTWWQPVAASTPPVALATLPSVTAASRASLFAGTVKSGNQGTERADFAAHPSLRRSMVGSRAPVLFHKAELGEGNLLAEAVRRAMEDGQQRVVAAVINAVDDCLDRSDQVLPRWTVGAIPLLDALLQQAGLSGRAVVILSDHGHVLDHDTVMQRGGEGARWRLADATPVGAGEVVARGPRVRAATGQEAIVLAASEALRYTSRKTGYHGGASLQEIVAPIAVLSRDDLGVEGWRPVLDHPPGWWVGRGGGTAVGQGAIREVPFDNAPVSQVVPPAVTLSAPMEQLPAWIPALLASPVYASQRALVGRSAPSDEQMTAVLRVIAHGGGRAARATLAAALGVPEVRVRGLMAGVRRVLNVDGFSVIEEEEGTGMLHLNRELLVAQFALEQPS